MKLYTFFRSSASFRVRIALEYKGLAYESALVSLPKAEHQDARYKGINTTGLVPTLEDGGKLLAQSLAIIEYLDEAHPATPRLMPAAPLDRHYVRALSQIVACEIHPMNNLRTLKYIRKAYALDDEGVNAWYRHWIAEGFDMLESFLAGPRRHGAYSLGNEVTMADCCLVPQVFNAQRFHCDLKPYPTVMKIHDACMQLEPFIKAQPDKQPDAA
jgi:maleylacetoacetate isomerase